MSHHICPMSCHLLTLLQVACASPHFNSLWGRRLPAEITLRCVDIAACSKNPSKREVTVTSVLLWDAAFPVCGQAWTDIRGRRRERIAELGKKYGVLLTLAGSKADGQSQMDALGWQVSHNSYRSGCWLPSPVNCVAWSALALSFFFFFFTDLSQSGQLWMAHNISACWLQYRQSQDGWKAECKMERKGRWWKRSSEGRGHRRIAYFWVLAHAVDVIGKGSSGDLMELLWFFRSRRVLLLEWSRRRLAPALSTSPPSLPQQLDFFFFLRQQKGRQAHPFIILSHYFWYIF